MLGGMDKILIIDFGSQYTHLIARRLHELKVYCEIYPHTLDPSTLDHKPKGIILSGGPCSVNENGSPHMNKDILECGIPVLGICYGLQEIAHLMQNKVLSGINEYGGRDIILSSETTSPIFKDLPPRFEAWMSHSDYLMELPSDFEVIATTETVPYCAIECKKKKIFGLQFHPEVGHTPHGKVILSNFLDLCGIRRDWSIPRVREIQIENLRRVIGDGHVLCAVSGGVDSAVAAALVKEAIGNNVHTVLIDTGLMRLDEVRAAVQHLNKELGINVYVVDAAERFFSVLRGLTDPEEKRKSVGRLFIDIFEDEAEKIMKGLESRGQAVEFLLQGTLYTDVIESSPARVWASQPIKSHHNVGGLKEKMKFKLVEPLKELFKDEVRLLGEELGVSDDIIWRHPFPGPGLAIRIIGEVTSERVEKLRHADHIFISELKKFGVYRDVSQAFCVLLPVKSVGVMGDRRTYLETICLRAVKTDDFMTSECYFLPQPLLKRVTYRIVNEVEGINRVVYDLTTKPPATIEWE